MRENKVSLRSGARESTRVALRCIARYERLRRRDGAGRERKKKREGETGSRAEQSGTER